MIEAHASLRAAVFYGFKYQAEYEQIAGVRLVTKPFATPVRHGGRIFMLLPHPVARAVSGEGPAEWYAAAGKVLRDHGVFAGGQTPMSDGVRQQTRRSAYRVIPAELTSGRDTSRVTHQGTRT